MAIFKCDSCGYRREVPDALTGKKAKCPDCGHGAVIVDADAAMTDEEDASIVAPSAESVMPYDLDREYEPAEEEEGDVLCAKCGAVVVADGVEGCPACGFINPAPEALPDITEDMVDVSDLAEDDIPHEWDESGDGDGEDAILETGPRDSAAGRLLAGGVPKNILAGLISGVLAVFFALSVAMLVASQGGTYDLFPFIVSASLLSMAVGGILYALQTRIPFALAGPETVLAAVLFFCMGGMYADMSPMQDHGAVLATLLAGLSLAALGTGAGLWLLGKLKVATYVRFVPIQVIGGVIGGIGVFVLVGSLDWMGQFALDWSIGFMTVKDCFFKLASLPCIQSVAPSIVFGVMLFVGLRHIKNSLLLAGLLLVASACGVAASIWGTHDLFAAVSAPIPHMPSETPSFSLLALLHGFADIQWQVIKGQALTLGALAVVAVLTAMMRITGLELVHGRESEINDEFRSLGISNMAVGLVGGMPITISYGRSAGSHAVGGRGPVAGIVAGIVCGVALFFINDLVVWIPRFVPEGLLFFSGLALIRDWVFQARTAFTRRTDMWWLFFVFLVTLVLGVEAGVGFSVFLALLVTVGRQSRGGVVRNALSGVNHRSNVDRAPAQQRTLKEFGDHIHILRLQGFMSLGEMTALLQRIQKRLDNRALLPVEFLVLDFRMVTGLASASGIGFSKLHRLVLEYDLELIITSAPLELEEHLDKAGLVGDGDGMFKVFFNLDYALEWCENRVLEAQSMLEMQEVSLPELLAPVFPEPRYIPALMKVLKRVVVQRGEAVFRQGDDSDSMYFVEAGRLDVELELDGGKVLRLKKVGPGAVFGEMGIYTLAPRSATVRAAEQCVLYRMTSEKLGLVEKRAPKLVTTIHRFMVTMLSERLGDANIKVRDLML